MSGNILGKMNVNISNQYLNKNANIRNSQQPFAFLNRTSQTDIVSLNSKQSKPKNKNFLLSLAGFATAAIAAAFVLKTSRANQTKAIEKIEKKFLDLQDKLPEVRRTFKEVFLRSDITEKEALEMLNRYKEIEKIAITGTKEEYIQAIFNEAKKNYGLNNLKSELKIVDGPILGNNRILGFTDPLGDISIKSTLSHNEVMDTIHHEMRHLKQRYFAFNLSPDRYIKSSQPKNMTIPKEVFEYAFGGAANISKIPAQYVEFAKKSEEGISVYCSAKSSQAGYLAQWLEQDAYKAGHKILNLLKN